MFNTHEIQKITQPSLAPNTLVREALVEVLAQVTNASSPLKLFVLCAPAGSGKTTLLTHFALRTRIPCCWYHFDRNDYDRLAFFRLLIASLRQHFTDFGPQLDSFIADVAAEPAAKQYRSYQPLIDALCSALSTDIEGPLAIMLCNYHEVNENALFTESLAYFIEHAPDHCHFFLESRTSPSLHLPSLFLKGCVGGFNQSHLHFSVQDVQMLTRQQGLALLTDDEIEQIVAAFGGWITGILLGTRMELMKWPILANCGANDNTFFLSLMEEAFRHTPETYTFLQEISCLQYMPPDLCNELLDIDNATDFLQKLEADGLFVTSQTIDDQITYVCHSAIREVLYEKLQKQAPEHVEALHRRATALWIAQHNYDQAIYHAHKVEDYESIVQCILITSEQKLKYGHIESLHEWIGLLPPEILQVHPRLLLIRVRLSILMGEISQVASMLDDAERALEKCLEKRDFPDYGLLKAEIDILRAKLLFQSGQYYQAQDFCRSALVNLPPSAQSLQAEAYLRLGIIATLLADLTNSIVYLQQALECWGNQEIARPVISIHSALSNTYRLLGNFALAEHHCALALDYCEQLPCDRCRIDNLICMGTVYTDQGKLAEAEEMYTKALDMARGFLRYRRGEAYALTNLGSLSLLQNKYTQALRLMENGLILIRQLEDNHQLRHTLCNLALTRVLLGDHIGAQQVLSQIEMPWPTTEVSFEQIRIELVRSMILLRQKLYDEALDCLNRIEGPVKDAGFKEEQIQVKLRTAVCLLATNRRSEGIRYIEEATDISKGQEHIARWELRQHPLLLQVLQSLPELVERSTFPDLRLNPDVSEPEETRTQVLQVHSTNDAPSLKFFALGQLAVLINDQPVVNWRMPYAQELVFFLLDMQKPVSKEQIIDALWNGELTENTNQMIYSTIYYLRKILGQDCIARQQGGYQLNLTARYGDKVWYDVYDFQDCYRRAQQAQQNMDDVAAQKELLAMIDLYCGDYAPSFFGKWSVARREELQEIYLDARRHLARIAYHQKHFAESARHWRQMLTVNEYTEDAYAGLMRCYLNQGKRELALLQYQRCKELWLQEFGTKPGLRIQKIFQQMF